MTAVKQVLALIPVLVALTCAPPPPAPTEESRALDVAHEVERIAGSHELWPRYDPMAIPLAIYTGQSTYLFRHPAPPEGFAPVTDAQPAVHVWEGRHPAATANSSADIGGTMTATLLADGPRAEREPAELAAVALHEAFHVFQRQHHPGWAGDEGAAFLYPFADARLLALRRLETAALRRALAESGEASVCWTRQALAYRHQRFTGMDEAFGTYERKTELNEGLATYVQLRAAGRATVEIPEAGFPATEVRHRIYAVGPALALLLDRVLPEWRESLEADDQQVLDEILEAALGETGTDACAFTADETAGVEQTARDDAAAVATRRVERRAAFDAAPGWRVVVEAAEGAPLWANFDPLNIEVVEGGLLHTRFLRLNNDSGQLDVIDGAGADLESFTEAAGEHPLFNGIRRVVVVGLQKPDVDSEDGRVTVGAAGLTADFENAAVDESEREVVVRLGGAS